MKAIVKAFVVVVFAVGGLCIVRPGSSQTQVITAAQEFKSIKVLNDMPADQMGKVMNMMSASLGVDCKFCHASNDGDYEKDGNENKETARKMIKMVFDLNKTQFNGRPEINCNSCHNGKSHPQPSFPLSAAVPPPPRPEQPAKRPTVDEIVAKYQTALGGRSSLENVTSRIIKSTRIEPDGKTTEPETVYLKGGKYAADLLYGTYVVREVFDGAEGKKFGMADPIKLKPDEKEQIKREAEMFSPTKLRQTYPKMEFRSVDRIDGKDVYLVLATTPGGLRERLYFDVASGLLVRRSASSPTILGNFVYQVDYADYKDFGGVKLAVTTKYAVPHIQWTRKIIEVK
ncbi:MAG: c-type cytochrome, partial [Pyrinomonadaceae bacterium]